MNYQDPQITQFTGFDRRDDKSEEINFGESKGELVFGLFSLTTFSIVPIDPTMLSLVIQQLVFDPETFTAKVVREGEFEKLTRAARPQLFEDYS